MEVGLPDCSVIKSLRAITGDVGSIPGWERSHGEGNGNPLQYSCPVHEIAKSQIQLSN